jgi:hypothetical protein
MDTNTISHHTGLTHGPLTSEYTAIYDNPAPHTHVARYASGHISEWYGPFRATVIEDVHYRDSYGRFNAGREVDLHKGARVFVTRYRGTTDVRDHYSVLGGRGKTDIPYAEAGVFLKTDRNEDGSLVFVNREDDEDYRRAADNYAYLMSR